MLWISLLACGGSAVNLEDTGPVCDAQVDLDAVREATARYADVAVALADGYAASVDCEAGDSGAMGLHYARLADTLDQDLDLLRPEILLYVPEGAGVRLVGVEYLVPTLVDGVAWYGEAEPAGEIAPAPSLFCRDFDGPMAGHVSIQPWHYDLHVWLFEDNPDGLFAPYNPNLDCDAG